MPGHLHFNLMTALSIGCVTGIFFHLGGTKIFLRRQRGGPNFFKCMQRKKLATCDHRQMPPPLPVKNDSSLSEIICQLAQSTVNIIPTNGASYFFKFCLEKLSTGGNKRPPSKNVVTPGDHLNCDLFQKKYHAPLVDIVMVIGLIMLMVTEESCHNFLSTQSWFSNCVSDANYLMV